MRSLEIGLVLPMERSFVDGSTARWADIRQLAIRSEALGLRRHSTPAHEQA